MLESNIKNNREQDFIEESLEQELKDQNKKYLEKEPGEMLKIQ